ncbi:MAG: hypothetical protein HOW73_47865 [Polyangiaceae bacterium]|nr:hypothetical protein [Polyangiaceae bacterium]
MGTVDVVLFETAAGSFASAWDLTLRDIEQLSPAMRIEFERQTGWKLVPAPNGTLWGMRRGDARRPIDGGRA